MRIHIDSEDIVTEKRVRKLLRFALASRGAEIKNVRVRIRKESDPVGRRLTRCLIQTDLLQNSRIEIEETQFSFDLAITRALQRINSMLQRKLDKGSRLIHP